MKKCMMSLTLVLVFSLSLAIPAYAADAETPMVSEEQYQNYLEIADQVSEERGIEVIVGDRADIGEAYTAEEFEKEVEEFCDVIDALKSSSTITPYGRNPSEGGFRTKELTVNTAKTLDNGYFLFTITGTASVTGTNPYYLGNVSIKNIVAVRTPSARYSCLMYGASTSATVSNTVKTAQRSMRVYKDNVLMTTVRVQARFSLNQSTGVVTMTGSSWEI